MIGFLLSLVVGAFIGWLASIVMKTNGQQGTLLNICVGVIGAAVGSWLFGDVLEIGTAYASGTFSVVGVLWATAGACIVIGVLKLVRVLR
jgi:uncharacterized membrane protein YeaQ/YmgE (transglycosylase-associated protein family)